MKSSYRPAEDGWSPAEVGLVLVGALGGVAGFAVPILGMSLALLSGNILKSWYDRETVAWAVLSVGMIWALVVLFASGGELMD